MRSDYKHNSILLNGAIVEINSILSDKHSSQTEFERSTIEFIKNWLVGTNTFIISTSGSTGVPKQIAISRSQMAASARITIQALGICENQTALVCLNTQFIAGRMMLVRAMEHNLKIIAIEPTSDPLQTITEQVDFMAIVPLQLHSIIHSPSLSKLNSIGNILVGGGNVSMTLEANLKSHVVTKVYQTYGMTETISHIALQLMTTMNASTTFKVLPGITVSQDDRECLVATVPYLNGEVTTNDIVSLDDTDSFRWLGRYDNVINTGGIKIMPESIEAEIGDVLRELGVTSNYFVFGEPDEKLGSKLILAFEGLLTLDRNEILLRLKQTLAKYKTPKEIRTTPQFCYTDTGKIIRKDTQKLL